MDVTLPSGTVIRGVPEGTPKDVIKSRAIAAGLATEADFQQAPQQATQQPASYMQALTGNAPQTPESQMQAQAMGGAVAQNMAQRNQTGVKSVFNAPELNEFSMRAFKAGLGGLLERNPQELQKILASNYPEAEFGEIQGQPSINLPSGQYLLNPEGVDLLDVASFGTDVAAFTPAGRITGMGARQLGRGAVRAMGTQAAIEGTEQAVGGEFDAGDVALAGGLQVGGQMLGAGASAVGRAIRGNADEAAQEVIEAGQRFDVPVMSTDVVPPSTGGGRAAQVMAENVPIAGTGGPRAAQQAARERATNQLIEKYDTGSYEDIIQSMRARKDRVMTAAADNYNELVPVLNAASVDGIPFDNARRTIESARETLNKPGRVTSERARNLLDDIEETISGPGQDFQTVKENIGSWTDQLDAIDPTQRPLSSRDKALLSNVVSSLRRDRDAFARNNLNARDYRRLRNADSAYGEVAQSLRQRRLKNIFDMGDATPEVARNMLFSKKPSEVRTLYESLDSNGRSAARGVIIGDIVDRLGRRVGGQGLTPNALIDEMAKNRQVLDVFFRGSRRTELNGLIRLLDATRRAQKAQGSFTAATGERMIPWLVGGAAYFEPSTAAAFGTVGALGRLYESPRVRTVLTRMANTDPQSQQFQQLIEQYQAAVQSVAQGLRESE